MLSNYLKVALRSMSNAASYAVINISGLTLGITCAVLIFALVSHHLSFENFHVASDRVYRLVTEEHREQINYNSSTPPALGKAFRRDYAYSEYVAQLFTRQEALISFQKGAEIMKFKELASFAEPEFFEIFNFPLVAGTRSAIAEPGAAFVTEKIARKYFGDDSPLDKVIRLENEIDFRIVGVLRDIPDNTDFRSEIYFSYPSLKEFSPWAAADDSWGGITSELLTFTRLLPGVSPADVEAALATYPAKFRPNSRNVHHYKLQPLSEVHFDPRYSPAMSKVSLLVLSAIGFFLVLTACLNFINLATAQAITRAREVGIRKTLGSARLQVFAQFTIETFVIVLISGVIGLAIAYSLIPFVNELLDSRVQLNLLSNVQLWIFLPLLLLLVTLLASAYPALVLSGYKPALALKGKTIATSGSFNLRRTLITMQFAIAQVLLIGLIVVFYQIRYFRNTNLGFNQDAVVMIPLGSTDNKMQTVKERFASLPRVENVSVCFSPPASDMGWNTSLLFDHRSENEIFSVSLRGADENYLETFDIPLLAGRNLLPSDSVREFLVNETFAKKLFLSPEEILGKSMRVNGQWEGPVVGVVSDFHDQSLHSEISPIFMTTAKDVYHYYAVKINMQDSRNTIEELDRIWSETYPELMFEYDFVDAMTAEFYQREETMFRFVEVFSFIALFIGCMGLYGLVSFMAVQKTKEIGIRKALGGSLSHILWIFGKEFSLLIIVAFVIAAPIGWWLMSSWLEDYAYHIDVDAWILATEFAIISLIALGTIGFRSMKAALMNPVISLRTE